MLCELRKEEYLFAVILVLLIRHTVSYPFDKGVLHEELSKTTEKEQARAVRGLLKRLIPERAHQFHVRVDANLGPKDKDTFRITNRKGKISVTGNRGYSVASGIYHYLKYYCGCHVSWSGYQLRLPAVLPKLVSPVKKTSNDKYRYYMNVCTFSYSTVWWKWKRWQREIDWMALNGINLPLAFTGQEAIWKQVFKSFGFTDEDIDEYFTGPAFLAWNRMGNIQAWAGPLSDAWLKQQLQLQHRILKRMRSFGMTPVLPAFSGRVPPSIKRLFPNALVSYLSRKWGHFDPPYGPVSFLEPADPLFKNIGQVFLQMYIKEFGTDHVYNADLFNEMLPVSNSTSYLADSGKSVFQTITAVDSEAIWLIQGWMFYSDSDFWTEVRAESFLTSVPVGRMIVLDLQSELYPQYGRLKSYFGQPFIWCMLHNYGGVLGLYGSLENVNKGPFDGKKFNGSTMIGTGITPEGIETNDVVYELMNEIAWLQRPVNLSQWIYSYTERRYGAQSDEIQSAWMFLKRSVYNANVPYRNHGKYIIVRRPSFKLKPFIWYNMTDVFEAWKLFVEASRHGLYDTSQLFRHDLVDVTRQGLQLVADCLYSQFSTAYRTKDWIAFSNVSSMILELYDDMEEILASDVHFLLGPWVNSSKRCATNSLERKQYKYNARNQITLWGPSGQILDYANKQWSGVMSKYYRKRWQLFIEMVKQCIETSTPFNQTKYEDQVLNHVETPFTLSNELGPTEPTGDSITISQRLLLKYYKFSTCL